MFSFVRIKSLIDQNVFWWEVWNKDLTRYLALMTTHQEFLAWHSWMHRALKVLKSGVKLCMDFHFSEANICRVHEIIKKNLKNHFSMCPLSNMVSVTFWIFITPKCPVRSFSLPSDMSIPKLMGPRVIIRILIREQEDQRRMRWNDRSRDWNAVL